MNSNSDLAVKASALAVDLTNEGKLEAGVAHHKRSVALDPSNWRYKALCAGALVNEGRCEEARPLVDQCPPDEPFIKTVEAYMLIEQGKVKEALPYFKYTMDKAGLGGASEFDYAFHALLAGNLEEGFKHYESRRTYRVERSFSNVPMWDGKRVKNLLVWCEQGVGDCIQFARYIPWLSTQVDKVIFAVPNNLLHLFEDYKQWSVIFPLSDVEKITGLDAEMALMSAPFFHKTTMETIPPNLNILKTGQAVGSLRNGNKVRIGMVWAGNPLQIRNKYRSMPCKTMVEVLGSHPNFELYSLQCGKWNEELSQVGAQTLVTDLSGLVYGDWAATGAVLKELDVMIAPCTGVGHLAAALGVQTYMCLHTTPDWRWFMDRDDSPFYPSVKVVRQTKRGDWAGVMNRVAEDIEKDFAAGKFSMNKAA